MKGHRTYKLEEYNPKWKEAFAELSEKIKVILGDVVVRVEHVGSTSIEGMMAKPQIDILVVVSDLGLVSDKYKVMLDAGFAHLGKQFESLHDDYFVIDSPDGVRITSVHVLKEGNPIIEKYIKFRNYLRTHPEERDLYSSTKKALYITNSDDYKEYVKGKQMVLNEIMEKANMQL